MKKFLLAFLFAPIFSPILNAASDTNSSLEAMMRAVQSRYSAFFDYGANYQYIQYPARLSDNATPPFGPNSPPDGFYEADVNLPGFATEYQSIVNLMVSKLTAMLPYYFSTDLDLRNTTIGYNATTGHIDVTTIPGSLQSTVPPLGAGASIAEQLAWLNSTLRKMRVTYVGEVGEQTIGADKNASVQQGTNCGDANAAAYASFDTTAWASRGPVAYGSASVAVLTDRTNISVRRVANHFDLPFYLKPQITFYGLFTHTSGGTLEPDMGPPSNAPAPVNGTWQNLGQAKLAPPFIVGNATIYFNGFDSVTLGGDAPLAGNGCGYWNWTQAGGAAKITGFPDAWCQTCSACQGSGTCTTSQEQSIHWTMGLGHGQFGQTDSSIQINAEVPFPTLCTPSTLQIYCDPTGQVILDGNEVPLQVITSGWITNLTAVNANQMEIDQYPISAQGGLQGDGTYAVSGDPFRTAVIQNGLDGEGNIDINSVLIAVTDSGRTEHTSYYYWPTTDTWQMTTGNGSRTEYLAKSWNTGHTERTETRTVYDSDNHLVSKKIQVFDDYAWGEVLSSEVIDPDGTDGSPLTTTYTYYSNSAQTGEYGQLSSRQDSPSGYWETYQYDSLGRQTKLVRQVGDSALNSADNLNDVTTTTYAHSNPDITIVETYLGTEVRRHYTSYSSPLPTLTTDYDCTVPGALSTDASNLVTITSTPLTADFSSGRVSYIKRPDGTATTYTYSRAGSGTGATETTTMAVGAPNGTLTGITDGTTTTDVRNPAGYLVSILVGDAASSLTVWSKNCTVYDAFGRPATYTYDDGSMETSTQSCCGPATDTDRSGSMTTFTYDDLNRKNSQTHAGVKTTWTYDPEGDLLETDRVGSDDSTIVLNQAQYDLAGRMTRLIQTSANNVTARVTMIVDAYDGSQHHTVTTTKPDGGVEVQNYFQDGTLDKVTGTGVHPASYVYGVEDVTRNGVTVHCKTTQTIRLDSGGNTTGEWTKTYTDMVGNVIRTVTPREVAVGGTSITDNFYNSLGQLSQMVDPDGVTMLYAYDGKGQLIVQAVDVNQNGTIDYAGADQITKTVQSVVNNGTAVVSRTTVQQWYTSDNSPTTVLVDDVTANGLSHTATRYGLATTAVGSWLGGGLVNTLTTYPDGSTLSGASQDGLPSSSTRKDFGGGVVKGETYFYDAHNRLHLLTDSRNGTTTYEHYTDDSVSSVTTPAPSTGLQPQTTNYHYSVNGQKATEMAPDGATTTYLYWPTGELKSQSAKPLYPVTYGYDAQGRLQTMTTTGGAAGTGSATTTWVYDANSGRLLQKQYADGRGPTYTYYPSGRLFTRTWARGVSTTYGYDGAGALSSLTYSDATPPVGLIRDRLGRPVTSSDVTGSRQVDYTVDGQIDLETLDSSGMFAGVQVDPHYDTLLRRDSLTVNSGGGAIVSTGYNYDGASRLGTVTSGQDSATYSYEPADGNMVNGITYAHNNVTTLTNAKSYDHLNRLTSTCYTMAGQSTPFSSFGYGYNNVNERTTMTLADGSYWSYDYDDYRQVKSGGKFLANGTAVAGEQFGYTFDGIGDRVSTTINGRASTYTPNALNEYQSRTVPGAVDVRGSANPNTTVSVNLQRAVRQGNDFYGTATMDNSSQAYAGQVTITGIKNNADSNGDDAVETQTRNVYLPQTPEGFLYDFDGNLTQDGHWIYAWDGENRLVSVQTRTDLPVTVPRLFLAFGYDYRSRRIQKSVFIGNASNQYPAQPDSSLLFVYDGRNLVAELNGIASNVPLRSYTWGIDMSGTLGGAGGTGGLLYENFAMGQTNVGQYNVISDGSGNVVQFVNVPGVKYEYGPFGESVVAAGATMLGNPIKFSSKYTDDETGLVIYQTRIYECGTGKWLSRDPIGEYGGVNLFEFVENAPINGIDPFGYIKFIPNQKLKLDADGAPKAYNPDGKLGLDRLGNAGFGDVASVDPEATYASEGQLYGVATQAVMVSVKGKNGKTTVQKRYKPIIQGPGDPAPGYFVPSTALENPDPTIPESDPRKYVDATVIPYIVYADKDDKGKLATVVDLRDEQHPVYHHGVAADQNSSTDGEVSLFLGGLFGFHGDARNGGSEQRKFCYIIYDQVLGFPSSVQAIDTPAQKLYDQLPKNKNGVPCKCASANK